MEVAGLTVGIVGLVTLFSACQDAIEQIDTYKSFGLESRSLKAEFDLTSKIFQNWAKNVGISGTKIRESHHPSLDDPSTASLVRQTLESIGEIFNVTVNTSLGRRLGLTDNKSLSSASSLEALPHKSKPPNPLQASSKRDKIKWTLGGKASFVKQVDAFGTLVDKLCTLVPSQQTDSRSNEFGRSFNDMNHRFMSAD